MAISTYSELQTAVENWLARSDLTARVPEFIALFEAAANRRLRARQQETTSSLTPSSGSASLPSDFLQRRRVTYTGTPNRDLEYVHPSYMTLYYPTTTDATPQFYTITGSTLKTGSNDATALTLSYWQKIPALSEASTTNWLLTAHPDAYLFGSLVEANAFTVMGERAALWKARRDEVFDEIMRLSDQSMGAGAIRVTGATP